MSREMINLHTPIMVRESDGLARTSDPVRIGVPFPKGRIKDLNVLELIDHENKTVNSQKKVLASWSDGTIKWCLLDFFAAVPGNSETVYRLTEKASSAPTLSNQSELTVHEEADNFTIRTGKAAFKLSKKDITLFESVTINGNNFLAEKASGIRMELQDGRVLPSVPVIDTALIEDHGPLRCDIKLTGRLFHSPAKKSFFNIYLRYAFWANSALVKTECCIHNPQAALHPGGLWDLGDPGSLYFKDLSIVLEPAGNTQASEYYTDPKRQTNSVQGTNLTLYQDSSGGDHWRSTNHVDRSGKVNLSFQGYRVYTPGNEQKQLLEQGRRATPQLKVNTANGWIAAATHEFWQNFPKALRSSPAGLSIGLFPGEAQADFELQAGEQKRHTVFIEFGMQGQPCMIANQQLPLTVFTNPKATEGSGAIAYFLPQADDPNRAYQDYIDRIIEGEHSFFNKREVIDEYGWRNFGDNYADHEAVNHKGAEPLISHYNNQYDFIHAALVHFLRSGDPRWYDLMDQAARHFIDIDIYHTADDKAAYNYGMFWHTDHYRDAGTCTHRGYSRKTLEKERLKNYGGGPSNEQNYSSGLCHYYYLTGDREARRAVLDLARWVIDMDDGSQNILGLFDEGPTGNASSTASTDYHYPGRGAGNSINTLMDAYLLSRSRSFLAKAEELLTRCIHPHNDIDALNLDDPEYRWSYLVFLQILGKYLSLKQEMGEMDYFFFFARDSLLHYAAWMAENEVPYKEVLHKVDIPTETWPAQDIRKCHVFHLAAKYADDQVRDKYTERAGFFFQRCLEDLLEFNTACLCRPLVLLCAYGYVHGYFQKQAGRHTSFLEHFYDFGLPAAFIPQKQRFLRNFLSKLKIAKGFLTGIASKQLTRIANRHA